MISITKAMSVTITVVACMTAASCSSDNGAAGDKVAFCKASSEIDAATADIHSQEAAFAAFTTVQSKINSAVDLAPTEIRPDVRTMSDAVDHALSAKDFGAFEDGSLDAPTTTITEFCK